MMSFDKTEAQVVLARLPLSPASRQFADAWLTMMSDDGSIRAHDITAFIPAELLLRVICFEITPHQVRIRRAGQHIVDAVGIPLVGEDYLKMAPAGQRATRLGRMCAIVEGHISTHQRWVVNSGGKLHVLNELALPCGLSEDGLPMIMTFVDTDSQGAVGHISPNKGAMNIAPVFQSYPIHKRAA